MASVSTCAKTGRRRLLFVNEHGKRIALHLGRLSLDAAHEIAIHVEHLVVCRKAGLDPRNRTQEWIRHIGDHWAQLAKRLRQLGLIEPKSHMICDVRLPEFTDQCIRSRQDVADRTKRMLRVTRCRLIERFGNRHLLSFNMADGTDFARWLKTPREKGGAGYLPASAARHLAIAQSFFREAVQQGLLHSNPFSGARIRGSTDRSRQRFVSGETVRLVLAQTSDPEFRLLLALARWGGLRTPSEPLALCWGHISLETGRITVPSVKTRHSGTLSREIPVFPELEAPIVALRKTVVAADDNQPVFRSLLDRSDAWFRWHFRKLILRAGIPVWPKLFQNLRSSRQTELEELFPTHVVCGWLGNSPAIARRHYLQVLDEHFSRATVRQMPEPGNATAASDGPIFPDYPG